MHHTLLLEGGIRVVQGVTELTIRFRFKSVQPYYLYQILAALRVSCRDDNHKRPE